MNEPPASIAVAGILAGNGSYPYLLANELLKSGHEVVVAGIENHFERELPRECKDVASFKLGALKRIAGYFLSFGARQIFFAGGVNRKRAWKTFRPDLTAISLLPSAVFKGDDSFLRSVAGKFSELGLEVCNPLPFIRDFLAARGLLAGPPVDEKTECELRVAANAAKGIGKKDRGQTAIVWNGKVVGTEGRPGTDFLLDSNDCAGGVMAKVAKPGQDMRFDIPTVGPSTGEAAKRAGIKAIGIETGKVLILEKERFFGICAEERISILGISVKQPVL